MSVLGFLPSFMFSNFTTYSQVVVDNLVTENEFITQENPNPIKEIEFNPGNKTDFIEEKENIYDYNNKKILPIYPKKNKSNKNINYKEKNSFLNNIFSIINQALVSFFSFLKIIFFSILNLLKVLLGIISKIVLFIFGSIFTAGLFWFIPIILIIAGIIYYKKKN